jgi:hypothetical protein
MSEIPQSSSSPPSDPPQRSNTGLMVAGALSAVIGAAAIRAVWSRGGKTNPCATTEGFAFESVTAPAMCEGNEVTSGHLSVGTTLQVGDSPVEMQVAALGPVTFDSGSEVTLVASNTREQRLALHCGTIESKVRAAPRVFVVEIPGANAIDVGSVYILSIDRSGVGQLSVTSGSVELSSKSAMVIVSAGQSVAVGISAGPVVPTTNPDVQLAQRATRNASCQRGSQ